MDPSIEIFMKAEFINSIVDWRIGSTEHI